MISYHHVGNVAPGPSLQLTNHVFLNIIAMHLGEKDLKNRHVREVILSVNRRERVNYDQHYVLMRGNDDHMPVVSCQPCQKTQY